MIQVIPEIEKVVHHENRIFRWYTDGKVEFCDLGANAPIFKPVPVSQWQPVTVMDATCEHNFNEHDVCRNCGMKPKDLTRGSRTY